MSEIYVILSNDDFSSLFELIIFNDFKRFPLKIWFQTLHFWVFKKVKPQPQLFTSTQRWNLSAVSEDRKWCAEKFLKFLKSHTFRNECVCKVVSSVLSELFLGTRQHPYLKTRVCLTTLTRPSAESKWNILLYRGWNSSPWKELKPRNGARKMVLRSGLVDSNHTLTLRLGNRIPKSSRSCGSERQSQTCFCFWTLWLAGDRCSPHLGSNTMSAEGQTQEQTSINSQCCTGSSIHN